MKNFFIAILCLGLGAGAMYLWFNYENRPCILNERQIKKDYAAYGPTTNVDEYMSRIVASRMFADMADRGCPEHRAENLAASERELTEAKKIIAERALVAAEIKIDTQKVSDAVNSAIEQAGAAIGDFINKIKNTRVSIEVVGQ